MKRKKLAIPTTAPWHVTSLSTQVQQKLSGLLVSWLNYQLYFNHSYWKALKWSHFINHPTSLDNESLASSSSSGPPWPTPWTQDSCYPWYITSQFPRFSLGTDSSAVQPIAPSHSLSSVFPITELAAALNTLGILMKITAQAQRLEKKALTQASHIRSTWVLTKWLAVCMCQCHPAVLVG